MGEYCIQMETSAELHDRDKLQDEYCLNCIHHIKMEASAELHDCCSKSNNEIISLKRGKLHNFKEKQFQFGPVYLVMKTTDGTICMTQKSDTFSLVDANGDDIDMRDQDLEIIASFSEYFKLLSTVYLVKSGILRPSLCEQLLCLKPLDEIALEVPDYSLNQSQTEAVLDEIALEVPHYSLNQSQAEAVLDEIALEVPHYSLNQSQTEAVSRYLSFEYGVHTLQGPPATGKSKTISVLVEHLLSENKGKIVITAPSNKALESVAKKLISKAISCALFVPLGKIQDASLHDYVEINKKKLAKKAVVLCTLSRCFNLFGVIKPHDVIIDEAGMATETLSLIPFILNPHRVLLAGDPKQLQPLLKHSRAAEFGLNISMMERIHTFRESRGIPIMQLTEQYRCPDETYSYSNKIFYNCSVTSHTNPTLLAREGLQLSPMTIVNVDTPCQYKEGTTSRTNRGVVWALKQVINLLQSRPGINITEDVVVICHYKALQADVKNMINRRGVPVQTVDSFQGSESKIVILAFATTNGAFVNNLNRLNVALTRATESLIVIGNFESCKANNDVKKFFCYVKQLKPGVLYCKRYEDMLCLPIAQQILADARNLPESYVVNPTLDYEMVMRLKHIECNHRSSTIPLDFEKYLKNLVPPSPKRDELVKLYGNFVSKRIDLCAEQLEKYGRDHGGFHIPISLKLWINASKEDNTADTYGRLCGEIESLLAEKEDFELVIIRLWLKYRLACLQNDASGFKKLAGDYEEKLKAADFTCTTKFYYTWGVCLIKIGNFHQAIAKLKEVCMFDDGQRVNPLNFDDVYGAYCLLGQLYWDLGKESKAQQMFMKAIQLGKKYRIPRAWAYEKFAGIFMDRGDHHNAIYHARKALWIHPGSIASFRINEDARRRLRQGD